MSDSFYPFLDALHISSFIMRYVSIILKENNVNIDFDPKIIKINDDIPHMVSFSAMVEKDKFTIMFGLTSSKIIASFTLINDKLVKQIFINTDDQEKYSSEKDTFMQLSAKHILELFNVELPKQVSNDSDIVNVTNCSIKEIAKVSVGPPVDITLVTFTDGTFLKIPGVIDENIRTGDYVHIDENNTMSFYNKTHIH